MTSPPKPKACSLWGRVKASPPMNGLLPDAARRVPSIKWLRALTRDSLGLPRNDVIRIRGVDKLREINVAGFARRT